MHSLSKLFPPSSSSRRPDVETLMQFAKEGCPPQWAEKAVLCLVKKLEKEKGSVDTLKEILNSPEGSPEKNKCVLIKRSTDGRLQVWGKKNVPNVVYCCIFRWPDVTSPFELKPVESCPFSFSLKKDQVCVNPWHYERVNPAPPKTPGPPLDQGQVGTVPDAVGGLKLFEQGSSWGKVMYFELNRRVGDSFACRSATVVVDGFTNPDPTLNRFSLGQLPSVDFNRNLAIQNTRRVIGKGVRLTCSNDEIFLKNLSTVPVFVQSGIGNRLLGKDPGDVYRLGPGQTLRAFSYPDFLRLVHWTNVNSGYDYEAVFKLTSQAFVRMSFAKGWGDRYHRLDVTHTPCWIEICIFKPLQKLDEVVQQLKMSSGVTSYS